MRLDRIMGVVLSILVVSFIAVKYLNNEEGNNNPFELIGDSGTISDSSVYYENRKVSESNNENTEVIKYTNTNNYPVEIRSSDIIITCTGSGERKYEDEALTRKNYSINAKFSNELNGELYTTLSVPVNKTVYIHVISKYNGELPSNPVECEYSLNVTSA